MTGPGRQRATAALPDPTGIQPPIPGALGPQLSQAATPPIALFCLLGILSCPHFKLADAPELPNSSKSPTTSHHVDHFRCSFLHILLRPHLHKEPHTLKRKACHSLRSKLQTLATRQRPVLSVPHFSPYPDPSTVPLGPFIQAPPQEPPSLTTDPACLREYFPGNLPLGKP